MGNYVRYLSEDRLKDFVELPALKELLKIIITDSEQRYQFEIRHNDFTVYYKGGKLSSFHKKRSGEYVTDFDVKYFYNQGKESVNRQKLERIGNADIDGFVSNMKLYVAEMDAWFANNPKSERENQQILCKKFRKPNEILWLLDIEFQVLRSRFDMIGVDNDGNIKIIELKVGNGALSSTPKAGTDKRNSGLYKHYLDFLAIKQNEEWCRAVIETAKNSIAIRKRLGLPTFEGQVNTSISSLRFEIWLADYEAKGTILGREIKWIEGDGGSADIIKINPSYLSEIKKDYGNGKKAD